LSQFRLTDFANEAPSEASPSETTQAQREAILGSGVKLRPYQEEAYHAWLQKGMRGVIVAPTGTGKTVIASYAIKASSLPTLVIVPTERILKTWVSALAKFGMRATAYYGREKDLSPLTISIYNSVVRHPEIVDHFKLVVLDEVHHAGADVFSRVLNLLDGKAVMALTATLRRSDGKHAVITAKLPIAYVLEFKTALEHGYVSQVDIVPVPAPLTSKEQEMYHEVEEKIRRVRTELENAKAFSLPSVAKLDRMLKILLNKRRQILSKIPSKREKVLEIVRSVEDDRILVFSESIESVETLKQYLLENGVSAETYHSQKPEHVRDAIFAGWGKAFRVLLAVRALDEGVDVPEVKTGIIIASGKETRQLVQRLGRLIRPVQGKKARLYVVYAEGTYEFEIFLKLRGLLRGWVKTY
jgi:superfamily II DNA or RNA helicase